MLQLFPLIATFASCVGQAAMADEIKVFKWRDAKGGGVIFAGPASTGNSRRDKL